MFSETDEEEIKAMDLTRQQQCETFWDILQWKGAKAFNCFVEAIGNVQPDLAYLLTESEEGKSIILIFYMLQLTLSLICDSVIVKKIMLSAVPHIHVD